MHARKGVEHQGNTARPCALSRLWALPFAIALAFGGAPVHAGPMLTGFALLDANTFAEGPTSGQFITANNGVTPPFIDKQPVQGFSAVLNGPASGTYYVMPDNGFGTKDNSADALLRVYALKPDFKTATGGTGTVSPVNFTSGTVLPSFNSSSFIALRDPDRKLGFPIVASMANYPNGMSNIPVAPVITSGRLLTGSDFDIESVRKDKNGNLWFGEEFGPFLVKTDATGKVLRSEIPLPNLRGIGPNPLVQSPQNPDLDGGTANLRASNGFEGMAINSSGDKLYPLLEGPLIPDSDQKRLLISEFDVNTETYTGKTFAYELEPNGTNIGDMTAVNDHQFLVIERDGGQNTTAIQKKIYLIDIDAIDANGFVKKTEVVDLLNIADPNDLNGDGSTAFRFPFVTIEDVLVVDPTTLLVINDDNYPGGQGRGFGPDNNEFILVGLDTPLPVPAPEPGTFVLLLTSAAGAWVVTRRRCRALRSLNLVETRGPRRFIRHPCTDELSGPQASPPPVAGIFRV
jgi:hypothetical protein